MARPPSPFDDQNQRLASDSSSFPLDKKVVRRNNTADESQDRDSVPVGKSKSRSLGRRASGGAHNSANGKQRRHSSRDDGGRNGKIRRHESQPDGHDLEEDGEEVTPRPSLLQPRLAVVLNVPKSWHLWFFALRLSSILPAIWWGLPCVLMLLLRLFPRQEGRSISGEKYAITEMALATIWCFASGYLSFFFTDCLMSRWILHYTPQAVVIRLLSINAVNAYVTSTVLAISGGFAEPRLLLPGWIGIATTLIVCYHITHQKINIRKETSTSLNVFSIASFISMITLLAQLHAYQPGYPEMPFVTMGRQVVREFGRFAAQLQGPPADTMQDL